MANYRRNFLAGPSFFFTVNLADRRRHLLTDRIDLLRAAFKDVRSRHPFAIEAIVVLPEHLHAIWTLPEAMPTSRCVGGRSKPASCAGCPAASCLIEPGQ